MTNPMVPKGCCVFVAGGSFPVLCFQPSRRTAQTDRSKGFTLLELIVALAVLAILSGLTTLTLRSHLRHASLIRTIERVKDADRYARNLACSQPRSRVRLEIFENRLRVGSLNANAGASGQLIKQMSRRAADKKRQYFLGRGCTIALIAGAGRSGRGSHVLFSRSGLCSSYLLRVEQGEQRAWLCVLGMSGQAVRFESESQARGFLSYAR